jgi:phosphoribosyl-AMP cyclohydrolase
MNPNWLSDLVFDAQGLIPAIAQDIHTGQVLMMAWMNHEALIETVATRQAVYWSRSRLCLWRKGAVSGHIQRVHELRLDCDGDAILLKVEQQAGIACHTGRASCFFRRLDNQQDKMVWQAVEPVLKDPEQIYK